MEILSSARSTILSNFEDLKEICSYKNPQNDSADFHFFSGKNIFTQINKKNGLEFLQIRLNNLLADGNAGLLTSQNICERYEIHRLRKMKIENLYCVAPLNAYEIALGMSNGEIRVLNYKSNEYISKFPAETSRHSVINLDYSSSDECLASVYQNGSVNIYGMKTKAKLETINFDENCTLAKFNQKKRFRLAVASYKGSIFLYDIQAHRKIFHVTEAHTAPCRDIAMSVNQPDLLYSAGYDSIINIYDVKKKVRIQQIKCRHPLSTISISDCSTYCCAGNLKGELITYDLRLLKKPIMERKIHDSAVIRVSFLPLMSAKRQSSIFSSQIEHDTVNEQNKLSTFNNENLVERDSNKRDSFYDYIEFQNLQMNLKSSNTTNQRHRESFDWDQLATAKRDRRISNKMSIGLIKKRLTGDYSQLNCISSEEINSQNKNATNAVPNIFETLVLTNSKILEKVDEENLLFEDNQKNQKFEQDENDEIIVQKDDGYTFLNGPDKSTRSSTPNQLELVNQIQEENNYSRRMENGENFALSIEILNQIKELRLDVEKKFEYLENEIKFNAESNKWNLYSQNCNFWNKQDKINNDMCDALDILLRSDDFYQDYCKLKEENDQLKLTLEELTRKNSI